MNFFRYAFLENRWLWFHILAAGILTRLGLLIFQNSGSEFNAKHLTFVSVIAITLVWEAGEYIWKKHIKKTLPDDEVKRFFMDAFGDVCGALAACLIILI